MKIGQCITFGRIKLRDYDPSDLNFLTGMWFDPENGKYMCDPTEEYVNDVYRHALDTLQDSDDGYYLVVELSETGERIGSAGIFPLEVNGDYDIGYCIRKDLWRCGYGSEVVSALLEWLESHGAKKAKAEVAVDNLPSNMLLRKFGFKVERESEFKKYNMDVTFKSYIYAKAFDESNVRLKDADETNWRCDLRVSEVQKPYVADRTVLLARAYAYRHFRSRAFMVCDGDVPVGMGLYYDCPDLKAYNFSQLFIDERYQGRGYGKTATRLALDDMRRDGRYDKVVLCYIEGNEAARKMYEGFGFYETDRDGDEIGMELLL